MTRIALVRDIGPSFDKCISTQRDSWAISPAQAAEDHALYKDILRGLVDELVVLPYEEKLPDAPFVEDCVVAIDGKLLVCRPAREERRDEVASVVEALRGKIPFHPPLPPECLVDGGDVAIVGEWILVGQSDRTNKATVEALGQLFDPDRIRPVPVRGALHLKSLLSPLGDGRIMVARRWLGNPSLSGIPTMGTGPGEDYAANLVAIGRDVIFAEGYTHTATLLEDDGFRLHSVPTLELRRADAGLSCLSVVLEI